MKINQNAPIIPRSRTNEEEQTREIIYTTAQCNEETFYSIHKATPDTSTVMPWVQLSSINTRPRYMNSRISNFNWTKLQVTQTSKHVITVGLMQITVIDQIVQNNARVNKNKYCIAMSCRCSVWVVGHRPQKLHKEKWPTVIGSQTLP